jgi:hypothetical protein
MTLPRQTLPRQSMGSQMADAGFLLALLFITLFVTTFVFADDAATSTQTSSGNVAINELPIADAERDQFTEMEDLEMVDADSVAAAVEANTPREDKYSFSWLALLGTVALALAYLLFVYLMSFKEFREVVRARFGSPERRRTWTTSGRRVHGHD